MNELVVVIPAYCEENTIYEVVVEAKKNADVIVVDDASADNTAVLAEKAGARVFRLDKNVGYEDALSHAIERGLDCGYEYVITMDADGQHDPKYLQLFLDGFSTGADLIVGDRGEGARLGEKVFAFIGKKLWGIDDPMCGMKGYRGDAVRHLGQFKFAKNIGAGLSVELVNRGCEIINLTLCVRERSGTPRFGVKGFGANISILSACFKLVIAHFFKRP